MVEGITKSTPWTCLGLVRVHHIEHASYNTFYPFQNKHQIYRHLQSVKLFAIKNLV